MSVRHLWKERTEAWCGTDCRSGSPGAPFALASKTRGGDGIDTLLTPWAWHDPSDPRPCCPACCDAILRAVEDARRHALAVLAPPPKDAAP